MKKSAFSPLYAFIYSPVLVAARLFYRRWTILGKQDFPKGKAPVIIVSNHQNALMDPLLCCLTAPKQLHFLTRADVFKNKYIRKFVLAMNMMPVYRQHDKVDDLGGKNQETFDTTVSRLEIGANIGIYPEGNHGNQKHLRPLKKGLVRLIEIAANSSDQLQTVHLVPVGIDYSEYDDARAGLTVNFGKPFNVNAELFSDEEAPVRYKKAMEKVRKHLSEVMVDHSTENYELLRAAEHLLIDQEGYSDWNKTIQKLAQLREGFKKQDVNKIAQLADTSKEELDQNKVRFLDVLSAHQNAKVPVLAFVLLLPFALPALIAHYYVWKLVLRLTNKIVKDPVFISTFKLILSLVFFPLTWLISAIIASFFFQTSTVLIGLLGLIVSGLFALKVIDFWNDIQAKKKGQYFIASAPEAYGRWTEVVTFLHKNLSPS